MLGLAAALLLGQAGAHPPRLAARRALSVAPAEVWTGRHELFWIRVALAGPRGRSCQDGLAPALMQDARQRHLSLQRLGHDLALYPLLAAPAGCSPDLWLGLKQGLELVPESRLWISRSLAQVFLGSPCRASAARVRAGRSVRQVAPGSGRAGRGRSHRRGSRAGRSARGRAPEPNLLFLGGDQPVPARLRATRAVELARLFGARSVLLDAGSCTVEGLEDLGLARAIDGLELYPGHETEAQALRSAEAMYRRIISYGGLARRVPALGRGGAGEAAGPGRAFTLARVQSNDIDGLLEALDSCRTVALHGMDGLGLELEKLGRVLHSFEVALDLELSRPVERIELWKEQELIRIYKHARTISFHEHIETNTAYSFRIVDGQGLAHSSGIWFEPLPRPRPALAVEPGSLGWEDSSAFAVLRNRGDAGVRFVELEFFDRLPSSGRPRKPFGRVEVHRLGAGDALRLEAFIDPMPRMLYVEARSMLGGQGGQEGQGGQAYRAAFRPLWGPEAERWERAADLRRGRAASRALGGEDQP